PSKLLRR
ncbi:hypothetical protein MK534_06620, partial [Streptococcus gallolyticus subsp. gallolyticus]|nr:hypothetical protein [Streptococcus gallolyticus subsp. gallolyticus]